MFSGGIKRDQLHEMSQLLSPTFIKLDDHFNLLVVLSECYKGKLSYLHMFRAGQVPIFALQKLILLNH